MKLFERYHHKLTTKQIQQNTMPLFCCAYSFGSFMCWYNSVLCLFELVIILCVISIKKQKINNGIDSQSTPSTSIASLSQQHILGRRSYYWAFSKIHNVIPSISMYNKIILQAPSPWHIRAYRNGVTEDLELNRWTSPKTQTRPSGHALMKNGGFLPFY